jgi:hypothetical protein
MRKQAMLCSVATLVALTANLSAQGNSKFTVKPGQFDPGKTYLVQGAWLQGIGCPSGAQIANPNEDFTAVESFTPYTDPACVAGDPQDQRHEGLLLAKTGPTANFAAAVASINGVKNDVLTELGFDIRKPVNKTDARGSHCGAGAPRFNLALADGSFFFVGCQQLQQTAVGNGWIRLSATAEALGIPPNSPIESLSIVFDEGQDVGPDNFGLAVLDNINVNGVYVGRGAVNAK